MPEYIKKVGEDYGNDLRKSLAEKLRSQQTTPPPDMRSHWQGIAHALKSGLEGYELGGLEKKIDENSLQKQEQTRSQNEAMREYLKMGGTSPSPMSGSGGGMGGNNLTDFSSFPPEFQNTMIDRNLKDQELTRKENFKMEEGARNRANKKEVALTKAKSDMDIHKNKEEIKGQEKKLQQWEKEAEAANSSIQQIDDIIAAIPAAKPGIGFDSRKYLANAAQSLGMDVSNLNLGDPAAMLTLQKGLGQLVINMSKEFGNRILKVEVDAVKDALPNVGTSPEALTKVLSGIQKIKKYAAYRPTLANSWIENYGTLRNTNEAGKNFSQVYDAYAKHKFFSNEEAKPEGVE